MKQGKEILIAVYLTVLVGCGGGGGSDGNSTPFAGVDPIVEKFI